VKSDAPQNKAFTLIEVIAVITVVAVLVAFLIPSAKGVIDKSRTSVCASNLRQIGAALHQYAIDNNQNLPLFLDGENQLWFAVVNPYLEGSGYEYNKIFTCPSAKWKNAPHGAHTMSYAYALNELVSGKKLSTFNFPSQIISVADSNQITDWQSSGARLLYYTQNSVPTPENQDSDEATQSDWVRYRHSKGANFLFLDGHVEYLAKKTALEHDRWSRYWEPQ